MAIIELTCENEHKCLVEICMEKDTGYWILKPCNCPICHADFK